MTPLPIALIPLLLAAAPAEPKLLSWAHDATQHHVDCPMTPDEAASFASYHGGKQNGSLDPMIHFIGCSCEANWQNHQWKSKRPSCQPPDRDAY